MPKMIYTKGEYALAEEGEANLYMILRGKRWLISARVNGELQTEQQIEILKTVVKSLAGGINADS